MAETLRWPVVLFDLDGTLANTIDLILASYDQAFRSVTGRVVDDDEARHWIGQTLGQTFRRECPSRAGELEAAYRAYNEAHIDDASGYPGLPEVLAGLRAAGARPGVVTAKGRGAAEKTLQHIGLADLADLLVTREDTTAHKPDPAPLLAGLSKLGATPADAVYVGDAVYDIQAARAAGTAVIAVTWGAGVTAELAALQPDALCPDAAQLRAVLLR